MTERPRKGRHVVFDCEDAAIALNERDPVTGLRFTIAAQTGGEVLIDYTGLRPRRLALAFARALRHLAAPGGPLGVRSTVKAYAVTLPRFFLYLHDAGEPVTGPEDLMGGHVDGFETWLEAQGLSRTHLFTVLVKIVSVLRQVAAEMPAISPDLRDRLRYVSAKPLQRSRPRDAYSPFVARELRDAARADVAAVIRRLREPSPDEADPVVRRMQAEVQAIIAARGLVRSDDRAFIRLYHACARRGRPTEHLGDEINGRHHLTRDDVIPFLVLLALDTGLEIECCKALTIDCLQNATAGTVEIAYLKRRARGHECKRLRVRDGGSTTPGGLIRQLVDLTAAARQHLPSDSLWVYRGAGAFTAGIRHPQGLVDAWTRRHGIVDDHGRPLRLLLSGLRKTHKALWYLKSEGHMARFAVGHSPEIAARHYADVPALRPLHEATVAEAFEEAVTSALMPRIVTPEQEEARRTNPSRPDETAAGRELNVVGHGEHDLWLATCGGFYASPHGQAGSPCPVPFWGCLECSNAVISARKLPAILSFLAFIEDQHHALPDGDWGIKFGRIHTRITRQILPAFGEGVVAAAKRAIAIEPPTLYLPPEARL